MANRVSVGFIAFVLTIVVLLLYFYWKRRKENYGGGVERLDPAPGETENGKTDIRATAVRARPPPTRERRQAVAAHTSRAPRARSRLAPFWEGLGAGLPTRREVQQATEHGLRRAGMQARIDALVRHQQDIIDGYRNRGWATLGVELEPDDIFINFLNADLEMYNRPWENMLSDNKNKIQTNAKRAREQASTRREAADIFFRQNAQQRNDSQNVHDGTVASGLDSIIRILSSDPITAGEAEKFTVGDIQKALLSGKYGYNENVMPVLAKVSDGLDNWVCYKNHREVDVLRLVWGRSFHPANKNNAENIRQALYDGLASGVEGSHVVCVQGRVGRMVGALATLDFDERTWGLLRDDDIRNEIRGAAHKALSDCPTRLLRDPGTPRGVKAAAASLLAKTQEDLKRVENEFGAPSEEEEEQVANLVKEEMKKAAEAAAEEAAARLENDRPNSILKMVLPELEYAL